MSATSRSRFGSADLLGVAGVSAAVVLFTLLALALDPGFFWRDDIQIQHLPGSFEIASAWREGSVPLLAESNWYSGALAGEMLYGVFSPFLALLSLLVWPLGLSLPRTAALFAATHLLIAALGGYALGRDRGTAPGAAALVGIVAALNGWIVYWAASSWLPALTSYAWLPWLWWALGRLVRAAREGGAVTFPFLAVASTLFLLLAAGWPYTMTMAMVVVGCELLPLLRSRAASGRRPLLVALAALATGSSWAAPTLLVAAEHLRATARASSLLVNWIWTMPAAAWLGVFLPLHDVRWLGFYDRVSRPAVELSGALVPALAIAAALVWLKRRFARRVAPELAVAAVAAALAMLPSVWILRWSFRWLPLVHLALALAGAGAIGALAEACAGSETSRFQRRLGPLLGPLAALAAFAAIAATLVALPGNEEISRFALDDAVRTPAPFRPGARYLSLLPPLRREGTDEGSHAERGARGGENSGPLRRAGNSPAFAGVETINGYSSMGVSGLRALFGLTTFGFTSERKVALFAGELERGSALLDHLGIDGVVIEASRVAGRDLEVSGWRVAARDGDRLLLERLEPLAAAERDVTLAPASVSFADEGAALDWLLAEPNAARPFALTGAGGRDRSATAALPRELCRSATLEGALRERNRSSVSVDATSCGEQSAVVVFRRPWFPGFEARLDGRELPVLTADLILPAVELPPGARGRLELVYRPAGLRFGLALAALGTIAAATGLLLASRRRSARAFGLATSAQAK